MSNVEKICERLENDWDRSSERKKIWKYIGVYTVVFLAAFLLVYSPFIKGNKTFIWKNDGLTQHYTLMVYVGRSIRQFIINLLHGKLSIPLFDINMNQGENIISLLNSLGLTDPLILLSTFVPTENSEFLFCFIAALRNYIAGISFSYMCFYFGKSKRYTIVGSVVYCFSGFAIFCTMRHPYHINTMIYLPLCIMGAEKILKRERAGVFVLAVFCLLLNGYYHMYMCTLMIGVYALVRFFEIYKTKRIKNFICALGRGIAYYCLGVGLAAVVFIPAVAGYFSGSRTDHSIYRGIFYEWPWVRRRISRFISPPGSWDDMALAAIALFAVLLLLCSRVKYRRTLKILVIIAACVYLTSLGNFIMNGFQYPSTRWTFGIVLLASFIVVEMMPELVDMKQSQIWLCLLITAVYFVCSISTPKARTETYIWVGIGFLLMTLLFLTMQYFTTGIIAADNGSAKIRTLVRIFAITFVVILNVGVNGIYKFAADQGNYINDFDVFGADTEKLENAIERDLEPYLLSNPDGRADGSKFTRNFATLWRLPGMLLYSSVANQNTVNYWDQIENCGCEQNFKIFSTDQRTIANTLLSEKYHLEPEGLERYVPYGYEPIETTENGNVIYENQYALPWGYTYDTVISYDELNDLNGLQKQEAMLQSIALDGVASQGIAQVKFDENEIAFEAKYNGCSWEEGKINVKKAGATIVLDFSMPTSVEGYVRIEGLILDDSGVDNMSVTVTCGDMKKTISPMSNMATYYYGRENYLFNLGYSEEERHELTITFPTKGTFKLNDIQLYALPMDNYPERVEALRAEPLENIQWGTNSLTGTVDLSKDKILCVSVPYSKGWSATVDGEEVEILKGNYMFMCLPLTAGHHDIEFHYCSPGIKLGAVLTVCSAGIVIWMLVRDKKKKKTA